MQKKPTSSAADNSDTPTVVPKSLKPTNDDETRSVEARATFQVQNFGGYRLERELGRGGMGVVYEATELKLGRRVALKVLPNSIHVPDSNLARFRNESRATAQLNHENIVPVFHVGEVDGTHFYSMRLIDGQDLANLVRTIRFTVDTRHATSKSDNTPNLAADSTTVIAGQTPKSSIAKQVEGSDAVSGGISAEAYTRNKSDQLSSTPAACRTVATLGIAVANALNHAHEQGIIHRDIKPPNLLLDHDGKVWVADFGLAQIQNAPTITQTGVLLGTLRYMSPEQASGRRSFIDHRTDIYSLGVTLYELLTLQRAFDGKGTEDILRQIAFEHPEPIRKINPSVPPDLETIVSKAMAHAPADRYQTADELAQDFRRFLDGENIAARRPTVPQRLKQWSRRHPRLMTATTVLLLVTFLTAITSTGVFYLAFAEADAQKQIAQAQRDESEGLRLVANSAMQLHKSPRLALELAKLGDELHPSIEARQAILAAADANHEIVTLAVGKAASGHLTMAPDGRTFVSLASDRLCGQGSFPAEVRSTTDGAILHRLNNGDCITSAAYGPRGRYIVTCSSRRRFPSRESWMDHVRPAVLWDLASETKLHTFAGTQLFAAHPAMFDNGNNRVLLPRKNEAVIFDLSDRMPALIIRGHSAPVFHTEFSPDRQSLLTVSEDKTVRVWDAVTGAEQDRFRFEAKSAKSCAASFVDAQSIILADGTGTRLFKISDDPAADKPMAILGEPNFSIDPSGLLAVVYYSSEAPIQVINALSFDPVCTISIPENVESVRFGQNARELIVVGQLNVYLFDAMSGEQQAVLKGHTRQITDAQLSPNGKTVVSVSADSTLRIWATRSGLDKRTFTLRDELGSLAPPALNHAEDRLALPAKPAFKTIRFDLDEEKPGWEASGRIRARTIVSAAPVLVLDNEAVLWDEAFQRVIARSVCAEDSIEVAQALGASGRVLIMTVSGRAYLWTPDENRRTLITDPGDTAFDFDLTRDRRRFVIGTSSGQAVVYDCESGQIIRRRSHDTGLIHTRFNVDGTRLLTVSKRSEVTIWDDDAEQPITRFQHEAAGLVSARFTQSGKQVVSYGSNSGATIRVWDADTGELAESPGKTKVNSMSSVVVHPVLPLIVIRSNHEPTQLVNLDDGQSVPLDEDGAESARLMGDVLITATRTSSPVIGTVATLPNKPRRESWLKLIDLITKEEISRHRLPLAHGSLCLDDQTKQIFVTGETHSTTVFDVESATKLYETSPHSAAITHLEFVSDDNRLVSVSMDGQIRQSGTSGELLGTPIEHNRFLTCADVSDDGQLIAGGDDQGNIGIWILKDGKRAHLLSTHETPVQSVMFDRLGQVLVSWSADEDLQIQDLRTGETQTYQIEGGVLSAELSPDETKLLVVPGAVSYVTRMFGSKSVAANRIRAKSTANAIVIDRETDGQIALRQDGSTIAAMFHPTDKNKILLLSINDVLQQYTTTSPNPVSTIAASAGRISEFGLSRNGQMLMTRQRNSMSLWNWNDQSEIVKIPVESLPLASNESKGRWAIFTKRQAGASGVLVFDKKIRKVPTDLSDHARRFGQRPFSEAESNSLRLDLAHRSHLPSEQE